MKFTLLRRNKQFGSLLIEALISVLILGVGILALAILQAHLIRGNSLAKQRNEATNIAQRKIEELKGFGVINTTGGFSAYNDIATGTETVTGSNSAFTSSWTVTTNAIPNYKNVTVTITWTTQDNENQAVSLSTIISGFDPVASAEILTN